MQNKEFLYIGHYIAVSGEYVLKIGTTKDLKRRKLEHTRNYRKDKNYPLAQDAEFEYDFSLPLSKYNTLRYEDLNRKAWQENNIGQFVRNDRFLCENKPAQVSITIRKTYTINL